MGAICSLAPFICSHGIHAPQSLAPLAQFAPSLGLHFTDMLTLMRWLKPTNKHCVHAENAEIGKSREIVIDCKTRPDTRLPQLRAGGQGLYLRSLDYLGRSSEAENRKNPKK